MSLDNEHFLIAVFSPYNLTAGRVTVINAGKSHASKHQNVVPLHPKFEKTRGP